MSFDFSKRLAQEKYVRRLFFMKNAQDKKNRHNNNSAHHGYMEEVFKRYKSCFP